MIKVLAACGAGINSSHQIKSAIEEEMSQRGYQLEADTAMVKDITEELLLKYDIFTPISTPNLGFKITIPIVEAGPILYRIPTMSQPIFDKLEIIIKGLKKS